MATTGDVGILTTRCIPLKNAPGVGKICQGRPRRQASANAVTPIPAIGVSK